MKRVVYLTVDALILCMITATFSVGPVTRAELWYVAIVAFANSVTSVWVLTSSPVYAPVQPQPSQPPQPKQIEAAHLRKRPVEGLQVLAGYFGDALHCHLNHDMPGEVFDILSADQKAELLADFNAWHLDANPDRWVPRRFNHIPDYLWSAYFMARALEAITGPDPNLSLPFEG